MKIFFFLKSLNVLKIGTAGKFVVECVSNDIISLNVFHTLIAAFRLQKIRKIEEYFSKKKHFHPLKRYL